MIDYFIIAGEESADNHGAKLIQELKKKKPNINFRGIGGKKMINNGLVSIESIDNMAVMGFVEIIKHLTFFYNLMDKILIDINNYQPKQIILIDYPGFNLRLAKNIKNKFSIPITYYISPQVWAWKEKRIKSIKKYIDQMLVIFPFEENWYKNRGINAKFVGHPIIHDWEPSKKQDIYKCLNINTSKKIIILYPGSRKQEVVRHLPVLLNVASKLNDKNDDLYFILGIAQNINLETIDLHIPNWINIEKNNPQKALECADFAIVASGTSTIEATVYETPMIIIYKMSYLSWLLSKVLIKVNYVGMVNIIANSLIMPEILQNNVTAENIFKLSNQIINNPKKLEKMKFKLQKVKQLLKGDKNIKSAADYILDLNIKK
tara:strand:- start:2746 stop:3873 length:1128 start_codon:yes stop_codon:yes gene_type:complete